MPQDPANELVDVIDANGAVIGQVTRREMRGKRLPHRCVYILVFNRRGELFIHQRTPTKDVYPSFWDVAVGGVLAAGEDFAAGAGRELAEELGVSAQLEPLFPVAYADNRTVVKAMAYRAIHDGPFHFQTDEVVRGEFVTLKEARQRVAREQFCPDGLQVFADYCKKYPEPDSDNRGAP
jgi:isopentenyldiphosphate isomerase